MAADCGIRAGVRRALPAANCGIQRATINVNILMRFSDLKFLCHICMRQVLPGSFTHHKIAIPTFAVCRLLTRLPEQRLPRLRGLGHRVPPFRKIDPFGVLRRNLPFRQWLCPNQPLYAALLRTGGIRSEYAPAEPESHRPDTQTDKRPARAAEIALPAWNGVKTGGLWVGVRRYAWGSGASAL